MAEPDEQLELDWGDGPSIRVVPARLTLLRVAIGQRPAGLARSLATSRTSVGNWESGSKQPTQFLRALAEKLEVSPSALALPAESRVSSGPHFRSKSISVDRQSERAVAVAELVSEVAEYFDKRVGLDLNATVHFGLPAEPRMAAVEIRKILGSPDGPIANMIRFARAAGAIATYVPKLMQSIDAYSVHAGRWSLILMTPKGDYYRHRWDTAHELGHLLLHGHGEAADDMLEREANAFAAELLLPAREIRDQLPISINASALDTLHRLKERWGVSVSTLVRRAHELGRMHEATFNYAERLLMSKGYSRKEPGLMEGLEMSLVLPEALDRYEIYGFSRSQIEREVGIPRSIFRAAVSRMPSPLDGA